MPFLYPGVSCSNKSSLLGSIQQWCRSAEYTHAYIRYKPHVEGRQHDKVFHSISIGTIVQAYETFSEHRTVFAEFEVEIGWPEYHDFLAECDRDSGRYEYARWQNLGLLIAWGLGLKHNPIDSGHTRQQCSEAAARKSNRYYGLMFGRDLDTVWPTDYLNAHLELETLVPWCRLHGGILYERRLANG